MKKILPIAIGFFSLLFLWTRVHAAVEFTAVLKSTAVNSITITVQNNGQTGNDAFGSSYSAITIKATAINTASGATESFIQSGVITGGQTRDITIASLTPATAYTIDVVGSEGSSAPVSKKISATTKASTQSNSPAKALYVAFVQSGTVTSTNGITISLKNSGTKNFNAVVVVKNAATGAEVGRDTILVGAGLETFRLFGSLTPNTTYNLTLTGTEVGSNNPFQTATYNGVSTKLAAATNTQSGQTTCTLPQVLVNGVCATPGAQSTASGQCGDGKDNQIGDGKDYGYGVGNGDHKADHYGVDTLNSFGKGDGVIDMEPDPSCFSPSATVEKGDDVVSTIIPCTDKCTFSDIFRLLNNFLKFFFTTLLIPIFIIMVMYAGYKYIAAQGNSGKIANLKKMIGYMVGGIILILCSWLIVRTIMTTVLNDDFKATGVEFLGN